ncbi:MAG: trypsin-like serine protease [Alphaproteobacteria bacterium]|nr:trypsin-like serine protease [Alphaproteobacteria bacterium]
MKKILLSLLLSFVSTAPLSAIQPFSLEDDKEALRRGVVVKNVGQILFVFPDGEENVLRLLEGTVSLLTPDTLATAGHVIHMGLEEILEEVQGETRKQVEYAVTELKQRKPIRLPGRVTFEPNTSKALQSYTTSESPLFYEVDSVILHPHYNFEDSDAATDFALVRLKTPVTHIKPLSLYKEGVIHPFGIHQNLSLDLSMLIKAHFSGYGLDAFQDSRKKRTVSQLCFVDPGAETIVGYVSKEEEEGDIEIKEDRASFQDALIKQKAEGDVYGLLHHGDSGGPLTVIDPNDEEFLIGIHSLAPIRAKEEKGVSQEETTSYLGVRRIARAYESYFFSLCTPEGLLRREIPWMQGRLSVFPTSSISYLPRIMVIEEEIEACRKKLKEAGGTPWEVNYILENGFPKHLTITLRDMLYESLFL